MAWRPAKSLEVLRGQLDASYPGWLFLGFLGDQAHAAVPSDHNPNAAGVVCALDIGPGGGLAIHALADNLLAVRHPDLKYLISNRRIAGDWTGWKWAAYYGSDPHDTHIHVSVGVGDDGQSRPPYDDTNLWNVKGGNMATLVDDGNIDLLYKGTLRRPPTQTDKNARRGQDYLKAMQELFETKEYADIGVKLQQATGNVPAGTYLKVDSANVIQAK
jgi:hypothetical protein